MFIDLCEMVWINRNLNINMIEVSSEGHHCDKRNATSGSYEMIILFYYYVACKYTFRGHSKYD